MIDLLGRVFNPPQFVLLITVVEQMTCFDVQQPQKQLFELIERASRGEEIVITMAGNPVTRLLPIFEKYGATRIPGIDKGKIIINPDFDDPLTEFEE